MSYPISPHKPSPQQPPLSLDETLYELIGAVLVACAAGLDLAVPDGAIANGDAFIGFLSQRGEWGETNAVVEAMKRDALADRDRRGISLAVTQAHARALCIALAHMPPSPQDIRQALTGEGSGDGHTAGHAGLPAARGQAIAQRLVAAALAHAALARTPGLREDVMLLVLGRAFAHVLQRPQFVMGLRGAYADYFASAFYSQPLARVDAGPMTAPVSTAVSTPVSGPVSGPFSGPAPPPPPNIERASSLPIQPASRPTLAAPDHAPPLQATQPVAAVRVPASARFKAIQDKHDLSDRAFERLVGHLHAQGDHREQIGNHDDVILRLDQLALWLAQLLETLTRPSNEDHETRSLKTQAAAALGAGDFEQAFQLLKQVRRILRDGRRRIEGRLRDEIASLNTQMLAEAAATARLAEVELARRDYKAAAELFGEARDGVPGNEPLMALSYGIDEADALYRQGLEFGDNVALEASVTAFEQAAAALASAAPDDALWLQAQSGLGHALAALGERHGDRVQLQASADAYRVIRERLDRRVAARAWAIASLHLGAVLTRLGHVTNRQSHWIDAASALTSALDAFERDGAPDFADAARRTLDTLRTASAGR